MNVGKRMTSWTALEKEVGPSLSKLGVGWALNFGNMHVTELDCSFRSLSLVERVERLEPNRRGDTDRSNNSHGLEPGMAFAVCGETVSHTV